MEDRWEVPSSDIQRHGVTNFVGPLVHGLDRQVLPSMSCRRIRAASVVIQEKWLGAEVPRDTFDDIIAGHG